VRTRNATTLYMSRTVGVAELRQNLSKYLRRVERGERLLVTDRNRPVAELGPPSAMGADLDRLIVEGRVSRPYRRGLPAPLRLTGDPHALSRALDDIRGERWPDALLRRCFGCAQLLERAGEVLDAVALLPLDRALLLAAGALAEPALRALDAIHVAAAVDLAPIDAFVSYDERQAAAARLAGLRHVRP